MMLDQKGVRCPAPIDQREPTFFSAHYPGRGRKGYKTEKDSLRERSATLCFKRIMFFTKQKTTRSVHRIQVSAVDGKVAVLVGSIQRLLSTGSSRQARKLQRDERKRRKCVLLLPIMQQQIVDNELPQLGTLLLGGHCLLFANGK
ncbi:hypothetical protein Fcan01_08150 [Folsomia candida]|uniref:Uncharacterized protein n=1 Tax=Folsomia candida TaxID=158441 RepID=A0A226ENQ9_FOLCA|nr:hypothetical protein Fcan01_08150 [Folsomia candida]